MPERKWNGTTYGSGRMHSHLIAALRFFDVRAVHIFASVFIIPVCLLLNTNHSRSTAYSFYRKRFGFSPLKAAKMTFSNHCQFSQVVIDRFAMYAGKHFSVTVDGVENFDRLAAGEEGFVMLSSHIGNYEMAGYSLVSDRKSINAVVYEHEKESVMRNRSSMFVKTNINMIPLKSDMSHLFEIDRILSEGNIVSFPTDRSMGGGRQIECEFFGQKAKFPQGPFSVAAMRGLNVLAVNVMKDSAKCYRIFVTPLHYDKDAPRKEQVGQLAEAYAGELEKRVRQYPAQWYNFYDFWA